MFVFSLKRLRPETLDNRYLLPALEENFLPAFILEKKERFNVVPERKALFLLDIFCTGEVLNKYFYSTIIERNFLGKFILLATLCVYDMRRKSYQRFHQCFFDLSSFVSDQ